MWRDGRSRAAWLAALLPVLCTAVWTWHLLQLQPWAVARPGRPARALVPRLSAPPPTSPVEETAIFASVRLELPAAPEPPADPCVQGPSAEAPAEEHFYVRDDRPYVTLTFDDGPSRGNTARILRVLEAYDVKATFFVLGHRVEQMPDLVADVAAAGHDVGNHTWSHGSLRSLWRSQIVDEVCRTNRAIEAAAGVRPTLFRPPFGRYPPSAVPLLGGLGFDVVLWSVDSHDWDEDDPRAIAEHVVRSARAGSIVLLHDREPVTIQALPHIIEGLRDRGFTLAPASVALPRPAPSRLARAEQPGSREEW